MRNLDEIIATAKETVLILKGRNDQMRDQAMSIMQTVEICQGAIDET